MKTPANIVRFLEANKSAIGFGNYKIIVRMLKAKPDKYYMIVDANEFTRTVTVDIYKGFLDKNSDSQENDLLHELIHGRIAMMDNRIKAYTERIVECEQEAAVNDIATLIMKGRN